MLKETLKRKLAVVALIGMLFSCVNLNIYADEGQVSQVQADEQNKMAFNEMFRRNGIDPEIYSDIDFSMGIPGLELQMFPSFEEYLFEFERRLIAEGPMLLDRMRFESRENMPDAEVFAKNSNTAINEEEVPKENKNRFIIKYKNKDSADKVEKHLKGKIEKAKKFDKEVFKKEKNLKRVTGKANKKETIEVIKFNYNLTEEDVIQNLSNAGLSDEVEYVQPDYEISLSSTDINDQWGLFNTTQVSNDVSMDVNVAPAWELSEGEGVIVAVIDSGIDITHQGLVNSIFINSDEIAGNGIDDDGNGLIDDISGWNFKNDNNEVHGSSDDEVHGTHVAGIIAAQNNSGEGTVGVAPLAKILPIKAFENATAYTSDVIEAIQYAEGMGAHVVNCSWGMSQNNQALKETMASSAMLFVCAAGNGGTNNDNSPVYPASYNLSNVISVASINNDGALSSFSNYGVNSVHVAAPGFNIKSTIPNNLYGYQSGTSMAAPFVSGEAALVLAKYTEFNAEQAKSQIIYSSDRLSTLEGKIMDGNKVNCANAVSGIADNSGIRTVYNIFVPEESENDDVLSQFEAEDIKQVETGYYHSFMVTNDGRLYAWGCNNYGQLGDGSTVNKPTPVEILIPGEKILVVSAGNAHSMAVTESGKLYTWGSNSYGQLGDGTITSKSTPTLITIAGESIKDIAAGYYRSIAVTESGKLYTWGYNIYGGLGDGTTTNRPVPTLITIAGESIKEVSAGEHSMAVTESGKLYSWGYNGYGQLGDGTITSKSTPTLITIAGESIKDIAAGYYHSMAVTESGKLYTWGNNSYGQLGDGTTTDRHTPTLITIAGESIKAVSVGSFHSMAVTESGKLYTWGWNNYGQLGDGTTTNRPVSTLITIAGESIKEVSAGNDYSMAVTESGKLYTWGWNNYGQLGNGNYDAKIPAPIYINDEIKQISISSYHSMAVTESGKLYTWGLNGDGQLGDGTTTSKSTPTLITIAGESIKAVSVGSFHSMAVTESGKLYSWGYNGYGQLGDGTITSKSTPTLITIAGESIKDIAAGYYHSMAVTESGKLYTWGSNSYGQLGDGTITSKSTPTLITIAGESIKDIAAGYYHSMAVTESGKLYSWGYNGYGQLGDGTTTDRHTPTLITIAGESIKEVSAGEHSMAVTESGKLYSWGYNIYGGLGDGTTVNYRYTPTLITIAGESIKEVSAGEHSMAVTESGKLYSWGYNGYGQLGDGTITSKSTPTLITIAGESIKAASAGYYHSMAVTESGKLYTWGYNYNGQLGNGFFVIEYYPKSIKTNKTLTISSDMDLDYAMTASNIYKPLRYKYYISYDANKYAVDDLCKETPAKDNTKGYIPNSNIVILEYDSIGGYIILMSSDDSENFTGILNTISFKSKKDGEGKINVIYYAVQ